MRGPLSQFLSGIYLKPLDDAFNQADVTYLRYQKAREQVKWMVADGVSRPKIRNYLVRWLCWWVNTSGAWKHEELARQYVKSCWNLSAATTAADMLQHYYITELRTDCSVNELLSAA